jgi:hypothetical protein
MVYTGFFLQDTRRSLYAACRSFIAKITKKQPLQQV